jgi:hypothetical protein
MGEGRPRLTWETRNWNGEVKHKGKAGYYGFKTLHCRCDGCFAAGLKIRERDRARSQAKRDGASGRPFTHGITGYRDHRCRCEVCSEAGARFNAERRARQREEPARVARKAIEEPPVDWSEVEHLKVGAGVRRGWRRAA